jgi:hypothetical protein
MALGGQRENYPKGGRIFLSDDSPKRYSFFRKYLRKTEQTEAFFVNGIRPVHRPRWLPIEKAKRRPQEAVGTLYLPVRNPSGSDTAQTSEP